MKIQIKYNHWFPKIVRRKGVILYPFILFSYSKNQAIKERFFQHEWIHVEQIRKKGFLRFYTSYPLQFIINLFKYKFNVHNAYTNINYEIEAYKKMWKTKLPKNKII